MNETIAEIVEFWLGPSLEGPEAAFGRRDWWYKGGAPVDEEIQARFGSFIEQACEGGLVDWETTPNGSFAMILLLDQFTRNIYRHTPHAYAGDPRAFEIVQRAIANGRDSKLHHVARIWLYHPFHHSETLEEQDRGIALLNELRKQAPPEWHAYIERSIWGWTRHRNIVERFGRFPHRNQVLGRPSTQEEIAFLASDEVEAFGQGAPGTK